MTSIVAAVLAVVTGCEREPPTGPGGNYSLTGRVQLTGYLVDADGHFAGTRVVEDATGVGVELRYGPDIVARTTTVAGVYRFDGLGPGAYRTSARVVGDIGDETGNLTVARTDVMVGDTLRLVSRGDIYLKPNPSIDTVLLYFTLADTQYVDLRIRDLGGATTRVLFAEEIPPGSRLAIWTGIGMDGQPAPPGLYWATLESGADTRAQLLFK